MILYTIQKGDTLESIAEAKLGDKDQAARIKSLNSTITKELEEKEGKVIFIPASYYKTQPGDTVEKIAKTQLGDASKKNEILKINKLQNSAYTLKGDPYSDAWIMEEFLSFSAPAAEIKSFETSMPTITQLQLEKNEDSLLTGSILLLPVADLPHLVGDCYIEDYLVKEGDTLVSIAKKKLGNPARKSEIEQLNSLPSSTVVPHQILKLPIDVFRSRMKALVQKMCTKYSMGAKDERAIKIFVELLLTEDWLEGCYCFMYPDPKNLVTVGLGYNVNDVTLALALPFWVCNHPRDAHGNCSEEDHSSGEKASQEEIKKANAYVSQNGKADLEDGAVKSNKKAYYDKVKNNLVLDKAEITKLAEGILKRDYKKVKKDVSNDPVPGIVGLLDIVYNAGPAKFPTFNQAVQQSDWVKATIHSQKIEKPGQDGIRKRNLLDYEFLIQAAKETNQL